MTIKIHPKVAQELLQRRGKSQVTAMLAKARDAFEESKVKRDAGGKFSTTGAHGGTAEHHEKQAAHHKEQLLKSDKDDDIVAHAAAMAHHEKAAHHLRQREQVDPKNPEAKAVHETLQKAAQLNANKAGEHASKVKPKLDNVAQGKALLEANFKALQAEFAAKNAPAAKPVLELGQKLDPVKLKRLAAKRAAAKNDTFVDPNKVPTGGGSNSVTHHKDLKQGMHLFDKNGQKVDEVEEIRNAMRAGERNVFTRAGYEHTTKGGHLPNGMYAQPPRVK